ncbi:MAG TPA: tetratricopeptide repeat protein [Bryobacteraceae bacterium]
MASVETVKVVVVGPSDVDAEVQHVRAVLDNLNREMAEDRQIRLECVNWKTHAYPGVHPLGPQGLIDEVLRIPDARLVIAIFWKRFGTPTASGKTGTEHEVKEAYESWAKTRRPELMVYFNRDRVDLATREDRSQYAAVCDFREDLPEKYPQILHWQYPNTAAFASEIRSALVNWLKQNYPILQSQKQESPAARPAVALPLVNVPDLSQPITGRDAEAQFLLRYLDDHRLAVIVAPPMFGKSAVIRRLLREVTDGARITREGLAGIVYLDGPLTLARIFRETGRLTGQAEDWSRHAEAPDSISDKLRDYWSYLQALGETWLIVDSFEDNLGGPHDPAIADPDLAAWLAAFLRRESAHRLILASRVAPRVEGVRPLAEIGRALYNGLEEAACLQLWRDALGSVFDAQDASDRVLRELSRRLHRMPAAIRAAAEYVCELALALTPLRLLERPAFFADFDRDDRERGFQSVMRQLIGALDADTRRLLAVMARLPEPVPEEACRAVLEEAPLARTLARLANSVMLASMERDVFAAHWYRLHAVVSQVVRAEKPHPVLERGWIGHCVDAGNRARRGKRFELAAALQDCARAMAEELGVAENVATALMNRGNALADLKRFGEAVACYDRAVEMREELVRAGRLDLREDVATALMNKGNALADLKRLQEAVACYDRAIEMREELARAGRSDLREDVATALMNKGVALRDLKRLEEAVACHNRAIEGYEELVRAGRLDLRENVATALMNKGNALADLKRLQEAVACYDRALEIREELARAGRLDLREDVATALMNKGVALRALKRLEEAVACYERVIEGYEELVRAGRLDLREDVAAALMNEGNALAGLKQFGEAVACYERAIEGYEELVRAGRLDLRENVATAVMNRGNALRGLERLEEAVACYDRAIECHEELVRAGRLDLREDVATALENKHILVEQRGDLEQALELIGRAVGIRRQLHAEGYRHQTEEFRRSLEWMAQILDSLGRAEEAVTCRAEAQSLS